MCRHVNKSSLASETCGCKVFPCLENDKLETPAVLHVVRMLPWASDRWNMLESWSTCCGSSICPINAEHLDTNMIYYLNLFNSHVFSFSSHSSLVVPCAPCRHAGAFLVLASGFDLGGPAVEHFSKESWWELDFHGFLITSGFRCSQKRND